MTMDYTTSSILDGPEEIEEEIIPNPMITIAEASDRHGTFVIGPLEPGYGITLGNPLRRVLYNSLPGTAITWVRIEGIRHEYSNVEERKEEVSEILLNLKDIRIRSESDDVGKLRLEDKGSGIVTAADVMPSSQFSIVNPKQHIATLDSEDASLSVEMNVGHGKGYKVAESSDSHPIGTLPIDAVFTPVRKVTYEIEQTRVGHRTDFEMLNIEIWTDGSMYPVEAMAAAANMLVNQFFLFANVEKAAEDGSSGISVSIPAENYNMTVEELELSSRTLNCLKRAGLDKVGEVLEQSKPDLLKIRNFGEKSYNELYDKLREYDILPEELDPEEEVGGQEAEIATEDK